MTGLHWLARRPWRRALAWLALLAPFFYLSYGLANHWAAGRAQVPSVVFDWERQIPFLAWTIFPYWSINVFYGLSLFLARTRHELDRHALRLLTAQLVAVTCFVLWPLAFSFGQPAASGAAGFMFDALRGFDKPFNQAPSLHIALAVILWDFYRRQITQSLPRLVLHVWTLAICVSVLTTYQHHFIDIPTGALLGCVCVWLWPLERRTAVLQALRPARDARRLRLAGLYALGAAAVLSLGVAAGGAALWLAWVALALALVALNYAFFDARGFAKRIDGRLDWAARWLFAPYRALAWLNARWWTRRAPAPVPVLPGLWLGRLPSASAAPVAWASVVDVSAEFFAPRCQPTVAVPMLDLAVPAPAQLRRAALAIEAQRLRHGTVLVHCALGYSRSAAALACWLVLHRHAATVAEAVRVVRYAREAIVLDARWHAAMAEATASAPAPSQVGPEAAARMVRA